MRKDSAIKKNLDLLNEFMKYAFDNPDVLEKIPLDKGCELASECRKQKFLNSYACYKE